MLIPYDSIIKILDSFVKTAITPNELSLTNYPNLILSDFINGLSKGMSYLSKIPLFVVDQAPVICMSVQQDLTTLHTELSQHISVVYDITLEIETYIEQIMLNYSHINLENVVQSFATFSNGPEDNWLLASYYLGDIPGSAIGNINDLVDRIYDRYVQLIGEMSQLDAALDVISRYDTNYHHVPARRINITSEQLRVLSYISEHIPELNNSIFHPVYDYTDIND